MIDTTKGKECDCSDWKENIPEIDKHIEHSVIYGKGSYTGKVFKYCPWCAKELTEIK